MSLLPHIGFVSNTSWSMYNFRLGVLRHFLRNGYKVTVMGPRDSYSDKLVAEGIHYINIPLNNYSTNVLSDLNLIRSLQRIYKKEKFDFIFHYTIKPIIYGSITAKWNSIPTIAVTTGMGRTFQFKSSWIQSMVNKSYKKSTSRCLEIWTLNNGDKKQLIDAGIAEPHRIRVLPSEGINTNRFRPSGSSDTSRITRFLFAGRLLIDKGLREYIRAAEILSQENSDTKFEVLGFLNPLNDNSISKEELLQYQERGIINYLGSTEDIRPYIDRADCVVFPSFYNEGMSRILMEAASMSTPIITTNQEGCRELVINEVNGYLCQPQDFNDLITQINKFLSLEIEDRVAMGMAGRQLVKDKYKENLVIDIYNDVINKTLKPAIQKQLKKVENNE